MAQDDARRDVGEIVKIHWKLELLRITSPKSPGNAQRDQPCVRYYICSSKGTKRDCPSSMFWNGNLE